MRSQRCASTGRRRVSAVAAELVGEPRLGGSPVAQDRGFRDAEQLRRLADVEATEESALDHQCLTGLDARQLLQCGVEREQIIGAGRWLVECFVERDGCESTTALLRVAAPGGLNEHLAHGP